MSKQTTILISDFSGGVSDDPRISTPNGFIIAKHFDVFSQPKKLTPYRSLESDTNDGSTATGMKAYLIKDYVYASSSTKLYGLGQNGTGKTKIVYKDLSTNLCYNLIN